MNLRPAEYADWAGCQALSTVVQSSHVWQIQTLRDTSQPLTTTEIQVALRCVRLPRPVPIQPSGPSFQDVWAHASAAFVADDAGQIAGYLLLTNSPERPALVLNLVTVAPDLRQQGMASALLRLAIQWAAPQGYEALTAACAARNHPAVAWLTRNGFSFAGYSEALYARDEIALLWQRAI